MEVQVHPFLTSTLEGGDWSTLRIGRFTNSEERQYLLNGRLGGPQGWSGGGCVWEENIVLPLHGFEPPIVQPVA